MPFPYLDSPGAVPANTPKRIDAVLFDYGMVLSGPPDPNAWAVLRAVSGLDEDHLHEAYWALRHDYDRGALTGRAYWHAVAAHAGTRFDEAQVDAMLTADVNLWTVPNPPMIEWATRLQRAGIRTSILSNIGDRIAQGIAARLPWIRGFDHCIWSYELSLAKPDPAIFLKTAAILESSLANILFIDDREENIEAAAALGIQSIQYADHETFKREMRGHGFGFLLDTGASGRSSAGSASYAETEPAAK